MAQPWLSVVMPIYNGGAYLDEALASVAAQDLQGVEIVAVDDGSTDDSPHIVRRYAERLPLVCLPSQRSGNWIAATNRGLQAARGQYISFLHQDDRWLPGRLAALRALSPLPPAIELVLHACRFIDAQGRRVGRWRCPLPAAPQSVPGRLLRERLLVQNFIAMPAPLFRRETALRLGGLDETLRYTADWDFWMKLAAQGDTLYLPEHLACFRVHGGSQTVQSALDTFRGQLETTLNRHLQEQSDARRATVRAARFSVEINTALAAWYHGHRPPLGRLLVQWLQLGPAGWHAYLRNSRIAERVGSRLRARGMK